ncbi:hypothetical protein Y032_0050g2009 [Ancylostoma ceylanicum]|uniref:C-type lectin domain-containing protein n=1 Tax=Ancylostoma ceylanicum TaxID=53326 RepID=A0A016UAM4_9BILA|nr:hypothetical protein Y032_0050g2009 [Ancylostoma ceylanicum]
MIVFLTFLTSLLALCSSQELDPSNSTCPEHFSAFTKDGITRCHNITLGSYSYDEADRLCRLSGAVLSTVSDPDELLMLRKEANLQSIEGNVLLNRGDNTNETCVLFEVNSEGPVIEVDCDSEVTQGAKAFACMLPEQPLACTVEDGGQSCKLVTCPKGQVTYYRKNGHLVCHKVINKPTTWPDAEKECEEMENGYKLASFEDNQEAESVMEVARKMFRCKRENCYGTLWIGGKRQPSTLFEWEFDGSLGEIGPYNNFDQGEPDGARRKKPEDCLAIFINEATYLDQHCSDDLDKLKQSYYEVRGFVCTTQRSMKNNLDQ